MDVNLKAPFFLMQKLHGMLKANARPERPSKVINVASIDGQRLNPWDTYAYHASKAGLIAFSRTLAPRIL